MVEFVPNGRAVMVAKLLVETWKSAWRVLKWMTIDPAIEGWKSGACKAATGTRCEKSVDPQTDLQADVLISAATEVVSRCTECGIGLTLVTEELWGSTPLCPPCVRAMLTKLRAATDDSDGVERAANLSRFMG